MKMRMNTELSGGRWKEWIEQEIELLMCAGWILVN